MNAAYETARLPDGRVLVGQGATQALAKVDSVVFDCDGTLIDVRDSYDATILKTVASMTEGALDRSPPLGENGDRLIPEIRRTGGFNSDWDITYALSLFSAAALDERGSGVDRLEQVVRDFGSEERLKGWTSVDEYLASAGLESASLRELRRYMGYPGTSPTSRLASTFDQVYYGEGLYRQIYGVPPASSYQTGLIDKERVIISKESLDSIGGMVGGGRMAMATGRPYVAVEHTLGPLLGYFRRDASVYIGDGDIFPERAAGLAKFKKPSGESLTLARKEFGSRVMLYVGDSAEDRIMAKNASQAGGVFLFAGVYGSSVDQNEQISYFTGAGSDLVVKDVNQIARMLEMARA
jgi:phosphoglycolate phosphatase-like HAD superfamily hydrolase